ncbi:hypothetical protein [Mycobacterium scrofulaceum]|nr:hypothetical protein [Mycobacterium scrofulaceum]
MTTALVAVLGAQRGAVGTPLLLKSDQTIERIRREGSFALAAGLSIGLAALALIVALGSAVGLPAILLALAAPIVLCQDVLRYVAIAEGRPSVAATWDGVWFLGTCGLLVSAWLKVATTPWMVGGWAAFGLLALAGMAADFRIMPRLKGFGQWVRAGWQHRVRFGIDAGLEQTTVFVVLAMVAAVLSPSATAALRGATVLLAPIAILAAALQLIVISESTRNSTQPRTVWYAALRWLAGIAALAVVGGVVLCSLPAGVGAYLLGQSFGPAQRVLPFMVVEYCATAVMFALGIFLKTFNRSSDVMRLKVAFLVVTLVSSGCAALLFRTASGVAAGLATGTILVSVFGVACFAPWKARGRVSSVDIAAGAVNE